MLMRHVSMLNNTVRKVQTLNAAYSQVSPIVQTCNNYQILCAVCMERKPIISRPQTELEKKVMQELQAMEDEQSMKSDHEIRMESDNRLKKQIEQGTLSKEDFDAATGESATEVEDRGKKELLGFQCAPKVTEADQNEDRKSLNRVLDRHLVFISYQKLNDTAVWYLPSDKLQNGESLREAAERIIDDQLGKKIRTRFYSNAPSSYYKCTYPKPVKEKTGFDGNYTFIMKTEYLKGDLKPSSTFLDYNWATRAELKDKLVNRYFKSINNCLIDEEH